jgi:hypothetical protein
VLQQLDVLLDGLPGPPLHGAVVTEIAATGLDDGVVFDAETATAEVIRDEDRYQGVRVSMTARLATARPRFHVDVNVGDPITRVPQTVHFPRILRGEIIVRGYPLAMVHAEKIVTAISRGSGRQASWWRWWPASAARPRWPDTGGRPPVWAGEKA